MNRSAAALAPRREAPLDPLHEAAVEAACARDRAYAAAHPDARSYVRPAIAHELCVPGWGCSWPAAVRVLLVTPALRARTEAPL